MFRPEDSDAVAKLRKKWAARQELAEKPHRGAMLAWWRLADASGAAFGPNSIWGGSDIVLIRPGRLAMYATGMGPISSRVAAGSWRLSKVGAAALTGQLLVGVAVSANLSYAAAGQACVSNPRVGTKRFLSQSVG